MPTLHDQPLDFDKLFDLIAPVESRLMVGEATRVIVDFSACRFLQQNAVILLGGMARAVAHRGGVVKFLWETLHPSVRVNLRKNGFLSAFGGEPTVSRGNTIPYCEHGKAEKDKIIDYLREEWIERGFVTLSEQLRDAVAGSLWEIYANADEHSGSPIGVISCGQYYPRIKRVKLTVVDFGIGIPESVRAYVGRRVDAAKALKWAFTSGTTTTTGLGRGLGLSIVKELVKVNHGSLTVFSNDGHFIMNEAGEEYGSRRSSFSGTIVTVELCCDKLYYCFASEMGRRRTGA